MSLASRRPLREPSLWVRRDLNSKAVHVLTLKKTIPKVIFETKRQWWEVIILAERFLKIALGFASWRP